MDTVTIAPADAADAAAPSAVPGTSLQFSLRAHGEVAVLALAGELDGATAPALAERAAAEIGGCGRGGGAGAARDVVLDLQRLYFLDEAGLAALEQLAAGLARTGRCLALAALRPRIRAFLQHVDAQALAPTYASVEEAVTHVELARTAGA
jgi:anti-anti-sigma factor